MTTRMLMLAVVAGAIHPSIAHAQVPSAANEWAAERYVDRTGGVSMDAAIRMALDREPSLRAARNDVEAAEGMRVQAGLRANPTMSFEQRQQAAGGDYQTMVSLQWPLEFFRRAPRVAVADREVEVSQQMAAERARLIVADVRMRYGTAAAAVRDVAVADEAVATSRRQLDLLRARVNEGASPPLDRDLSEVEALRVESDQLLAMSRADAALIDLRRALGLPANMPLKLRDTLETLVIAPPSLVTPAVDSMIAGRPDVRIAAARVDLAKAQVDRAVSQGRVDVNVFGSYMRMDTSFPQRAFDVSGALVPVQGVFNYAAAGATLTIPLRNKNQGEIAAARAAVAGAAATVEATTLSAQAELAAATVRSRQTQAAVTRLEEGVRLARRNVDVIRQTYELGRTTVRDVLAEQRRYLDLERAYTNALREAYEAQAAVRNARGERP